MIIKGEREELIKKTATLISERALQLLKSKQHVVIAVPGGSSVAAVYRELSGLKMPWKNIHLFLVDERLVPVDHPESNVKLIRENMGTGLPSGLIHPFDSSVQTPEQALAEYQKELDLCGGKLDIVLLSSGEDGHIASLFPRHPLLNETQERFCLLDDSPKPPPGRMTASPGLIETADTGILLFFGEGKAQALQRYLDPQLLWIDCPAKIITKIPHHYLLTDQEIEKI
ncbi:6-phosphogluconolactonase [Desulforhopalus sp. IMCC35007]|uniref:6-phosphogluconolactonase n=1 Tax=Desulforhopalus sp. IMCC35007 TaxID=2569543 RepID=UPI0010ADFA69|nr:6-phosphogluconolactonase [Desulforhopalus sp. IMCC35007]TKB09278.1 6-phosphogluconolactonase [Desulforhopalus sp. IMCC35007]